MPTNMFERISDKFIADLQIKPKIVVLESSGFSSDYADKYYLKIRGYSVKYYCKYHIAVDVDSRMILYSQAVKGPRHDTKFAITSIRSLKQYNV